MSRPGAGSDEVKRLIDVECRAATYIPLQEAIAPFLIEPFVRNLAWPYAIDRNEYPCWIWFSRLEDAFIATGAWPYPLPDDYEVR